MNKSSLGIKSGVVPDHFCRMAPTCFSLTLVWTTRYYESAFTQAPAIQLIIVAAAFASARRRARGRHWADATTDVARGGSQLDTLATTGKTKYRRPITSTGRRSPSTSEVLVVNSDVQQLNPLFNWYLRSGPLDFREDTVAHGKWWETIRTLCVCADGDKALEESSEFRSALAKSEEQLADVGLTSRLSIGLSSTSAHSRKFMALDTCA